MGFRLLDLVKPLQRVLPEVTKAGEGRRLPFSTRQGGCGGGPGGAGRGEIGAAMGPGAAGRAKSSASRLTPQPPGRRPQVYVHRRLPGHFPGVLSGGQAHGGAVGGSRAKAAAVAAVGARDTVWWGAARWRPRLHTRPARRGRRLAHLPGAACRFRCMASRAWRAPTRCTGRA